MVLLLTGLICANAALLVFALHVDPLTGRIGHAARRAWCAQLRTGWRTCWLTGWQIMRNTFTGQHAASRSARLLATADLDARIGAGERIRF
ncbi:hypothetical protein [Burkholderia anthina]|uniref:hypothetical protein n=1 Tax=Burkholderia anthina TaxID=179879 RepID=UPI001589CC91|nr:hypothetical protein [Burkholderia anthina]